MDRLVSLGAVTAEAEGSALTFICPHPLAGLKQPCVAGTLVAQFPSHPVAAMNSSLCFPSTGEGSVPPLRKKKSIFPVTGEVIDEIHVVDIKTMIFSYH